MRYFDNSPFKTNKIKDLFINSDTRNTNNSDEYLSVVRDVGVIKYSERGDSGNKTSDSPEKYKMVDVGDLVINPMNVTIGSVGVSEYSGCLSGVYLVLKPKTSVNSKYYHYLFHDKGFQKYLKTISYGIMEIRESLNKTELFQFKIPKPSVDEQEEIVSYLNKKTTQIDKLIKKIEQKIELLKEQRTSLINEVVTKGLNPNVEMKDSGVEWIGEVPSSWSSGKIKFFTETISKGTTPSTIGKETLDDGPVIYIKVENIKESTVDFPPKCFIDKETDELLSRSKLIENDILVVITGSTTGKVVILPKEFTPSNTNQGISFIRLKDKSNENVRYFWYWLISEKIQNQIKVTYTQSTQPNLSMELMGNFYIPVPNEDEKTKIVEYLDEQTQLIDKTISTEQKRIDLLKEYKQSLISEVVTGKKRVV